MDFPQKVNIQLELEIEVENEDRYLLIFPAPSSSHPLDLDKEGKVLPLRLSFLADLFDLLNFEGELGVQSINGWTHPQIKKTLAAL